MKSRSSRPSSSATSSATGPRRVSESPAAEVSNAEQALKSAEEGPTGTELDGYLAAAFGPRVYDLPAVRTDDAAARGHDAHAFTEGRQITLGAKALGDDASAMAIVGEEVAHALANGGSGETRLDQADDPGEASAKSSGRSFAAFALGGAVPSLGPAFGGRAEIHRSAAEEAGRDSGGGGQDHGGGGQDHGGGGQDHGGGGQEGHSEGQDQGGDQGQQDHSEGEDQGQEQDEGEDQSEDHSEGEDQSEDHSEGEDQSEDHSQGEDHGEGEDQGQDQAEDLSEENAHGEEETQEEEDQSLDLEATEELSESDPVQEALEELAEDQAELAEAEEAVAAGEAEQVTVDEMLEQQIADLGGSMLSLSPDQQAELMEKGGAAHIEKVLDVAVASKNPQVLEGVVDTLTAVTERLGAREVDLVAGAVEAVGIEKVSGPVLDALHGGLGATLAVEIAFGGSLLDGQIRERNDLAVEVSQALDASASGFKAKADQVADLRAQLASGIERMNATGAHSTQAWVEDFKAEHQGTFAAFETAAAQYASTLNGRAHGQDLAPSPMQDFSLEYTGELATTQMGGRAVADALSLAGERSRYSADPQETWVDKAKEEIAAEDFGRLAAQGVMQGVGAMAAVGDVAGLDDIFSGYQRAMPGAADAIQDARDRLEDLAGLDADALSRGLADALDPKHAPPEQRGLFERIEMAARIGTTAGVAAGTFGLLSNVPDPKGAERFQRLGKGFGAMANGFKAISLLDEPQLERIALGAAELGFDVVEVVAKLGPKANLGAGVVFGLVDAGLHLAKGNLKAAGVAMLPMAGMILGGVLGGGVPGAAIGGAVGSALSGVLSLLGVGDVDKVEELVAPALSQALTEKGFAAPTADLLVEKLKTKDFGEKFGAVAQRMGMTPEALLDDLVTAPPSYVSWLVNETSRYVDFEATPGGGRQLSGGHRQGQHFNSVEQITPSVARADPQWNGHRLTMARATPVN